MVNLAKPLASAFLGAAVAGAALAGQLVQDEKPRVVPVAEFNGIDCFDLIMAALFDAELVAKRVIDIGGEGRVACCVLRVACCVLRGAGGGGRGA